MALETGGQKKWLLSEDHRQSLLRQIFQHLSQAFQQLSASNPKSDDQRFLKDVMRIYRTYSCQKDYYARLSEKTWDFLLKVLMGIYDYVTTIKSANNKASVLDVLVDCSQLTLLTCFIHCGLQQQDIWSLFS